MFLEELEMRKGKCYKTGEWLGAASVLDIISILLSLDNIAAQFVSEISKFVVTTIGKPLCI
jgi:hypothetical protein